MAEEPTGIVDILILFLVSIFRFLVNSFGYLWLGIAMFALFLIYDLLKLFFVVIAVLISKRPEGTGIMDSISYELGHGREKSGGTAFGVAVTALGLIAVYTTEEKARHEDLNALLFGNPIASVGGLLFGVGTIIIYNTLKNLVKNALFGGWYYEEPEVRRMKAQMMSAFKQGRSLDAINLFKSDLKSLKEQFSDADALKFEFKKEEKEINGILAIFKRAEGYCKEGKMKSADSEMSSAKKKYDALRPRVATKLRHYKRIKSAIASLKRLSKNIENSLKDCERNKLDVSVEDECYRRLDMNKVLLASESFWRDDNYKEAIRELEGLKGDFEKIHDSIEKRLKDYNELLSRKFSCLQCGKNMNLANDVCPSCGTEPAKNIIDMMSKLADSLYSSGKRIEEAKRLMNFDEEEAGLEEIQVALDSITKQVDRGEFDKATSLLVSTKASEEALVAETKEKLELYGNISGKMSELKKLEVDIGSSVEASRNQGVDIKREEGMYSKAKEGSSLEMIEGLCKSGAYSEAISRLDGALAKYGEVGKALSAKAERYKELSAITASIEETYGQTIKIMGDAKSKKIDVSIEERNLHALNIGALKNKSKSLSKEAEGELRKVLSEIGKTKASVSKKLDMYSGLKDMGGVLEERVKELRGLISRGISLKLDIKEEHEKFYSIKMDRIRGMLESCEDIVALKKELDTALDTTQWCIASLSDKISEVDECPRWVESIESEMKGKKSVHVDSLKDIPGEWRLWAMDRYIEAHPEYAFVVYQDKLIRTISVEQKRHYEEILSGMVSSGKIMGCAIFDESGVIMASAFPEAKDVLKLGGPVADIVEKGKALCREAEIGKAGQVVVGTDEFKIVIKELSKSLFLLCALKPKENIAFTSIVISGGIKKVNEITG